MREETMQRRPGKETLWETPESNEGEVAWEAERGPLPPLKIDMKSDLPTYDGEVDGEKLDGWIDGLESYFDIYGYNDSRRLAIARLKLSSHVWCGGTRT